MPGKLIWIILSLSLCLWPNPVSPFDLPGPKTAIPALYFGMHIHHLTRPTPTPWPTVPIPAWRLWDADVTWPDLEPIKGQWQFDRLDTYVSAAEQHGTNVLLPLAMSPGWAAARGQVNAEPKDLEDWRTYVRTVVTRYKGRIQAYEIWNEPNLRDFWTGRTDQIVVLTKEAYQIIRSVDPKAVLVSPSATAAYGVPWLAEFLKQGGGQYVDVIGFHFYVDPHTLSPEDMLPVIRHVQQVLSENGAENKPLWNTETGWLRPAKFDSDELAAAFLARAFLVSWVSGVQRFYWYAWDNQYTTIITYNESTRSVTPAGYAFGVIQQWLIGATMDSCAATPDHTWTCQLNRSGKNEWIVWNPDGKRLFTVPHAWHVRDTTILLHDSRPLTGSNLEIGPVPTLLTGHP
jgi:hypothetical protein